MKLDIVDLATSLKSQIGADCTAAFEVISLEYFDTWQELVITEAGGLKIPPRVCGFRAIEASDYIFDYRIVLFFGDDL